MKSLLRTQIQTEILLQLGIFEYSNQPIIFTVIQVTIRFFRATNDILPESSVLHLSQSMKQMKESGLPATVGYLVLLWEEIRSYCTHAILQQVLVSSPLNAAPSAGSASAARKSDSKRDRERKMKKSRTRGNEDGDNWYKQGFEFWNMKEIGFF